MSDLQCPARIVLLRHGAAVYEAAVTTGSGGTLSPRGRAQARAAAEGLARERVAHVYASMLARAVQTAELLAAALGVQATAREGLQEFDPGAHHGSAHDSGWAASTMAAWADGDLDAHWEGGESARQISARMLAVLDQLADLHRGETVVVVTHGGAMSAVLACWGWAGRDRDVAPCEGLVLERDGDGWRQCGRVGRTFIGELPDGGRAIPTTLRDGGSGQTA